MRRVEANPVERDKASEFYPERVLISEAIVISGLLFPARLHGPRRCRGPRPGLEGIGDADRGDQFGRILFQVLALGGDILPERGVRGGTAGVEFAA